MKKILLVAALVLGVGTATAFANNWHEVSRTNQYIVTAEFPGKTLKVGENPISVKIRDAAGNSVADSRVLVRYDMPGMNHDLKEGLNGNYITKDLISTGGEYKGSLNFSMPGEWVVDVQTTRAGKSYTASYTVNVVR